MTKETFKFLAQDYEKQTRFHSLPGPMRKTTAYATLVAGGQDTVRWIIEGFAAHDAKYKDPSTEGFFDNPDTCWGMNWVLLLMDITHESPIAPESAGGGLMAAWDVNATCRAWIEWGKSHAE